MSQFQSFLIVAPTGKLAREQTKKLAGELKIDLEKVSPDIFIITPQKREISIDQVRELKSHIFQKPVDLAYKFIVIGEAHNATIPAQNSLLKILEEPPEHAIIILETQNKASLLPTIVSRTKVLSTSQTSPDQEILLGKNLGNALAAASQVEDPQEFLDGQIITAAKLLGNKAKGQKVDHSFLRLAQSIEQMGTAKQMIDANVNPTFVLANLVFSLNL